MGVDAIVDAGSKFEDNYSNTHNLILTFLDYLITLLRTALVSNLIA